MRNVLIICFFLFIYNTTEAQNLIRGKITGADSIPLSGSSVFIPEINRGTIADKNGNYEFRNLPKGEIKIQFSCVGHANKIETVDLGAGALVLDVSLQPTILESERIIVSGGYHSTQHENAVRIDILKLNPLENKATPNFAELLTKIPGVDMISKGNGVARPVIRGLSMNDILILNNGVRFENYQYSSHHPMGIDEFGIEDVEVIKGPASLLYGSDAIGGVLNFIKEKPAEHHSISGDYNLQMYSNSIGFSQNAGIKTASEHFFGGVRVGNKSNADYLQGGGDFVANSRSNEYSVKTHAGYTGKAGTFKLFYDYNNQNLGLVEHEAVELIGKRGRRPDRFFQNLNTHLLSMQNRLYLGRVRMDLNASIQNTELTHTEEVDEIETQMRLLTLTYESKIYLPSDNRSEYIIGFQGFNQQNENLNDRETILLPDARTKNYSGFFLFQRTLPRKIKLQAGLRYDYRKMVSDSVGTAQDPFTFRPALDKPFSGVNGSLGATYPISEKILLRSNIATAFRAPNFAELTSNGEHETRYEIGDPELIPEKSYEGDISMHYHGDHFSLDVAGFYNTIDNFLFIAPTGDTTDSGVSIYKYKQQNAEFFGGEAGFHYHPPFIKWLHFESTFATVIGKQGNGDNLPFIPASKINLQARGEKERFIFLRDAFLSVNAQWAAAQRRVAPEETMTPGYILFDLSAGGKIKMKREDWIITISVTNIFDRKYIDHLSTLKEVNRFNPGRNIALTLKIPFYHNMKAGN